MSGVPEAAILAIEEAFLRQMRAERPDLHWEIVEDDEQDEDDAGGEG